jgi:hypothetical protein
MSEPYNVTVDGANPQYWNYTLYDDGAHRWIYFTYQQSKRKVVIQGSDTAPIISILSPQNKTYPVKDVPLTYKVDEPPNWTGYRLDDMANVTITGNITIPNLPDGSHHITVYANDSAGNMGASSTVHFSVDTTPPAITIISPENKTYETASIWLNFTVDKLTAWIGYGLDDNANETVTGNTTIMVDDGPHSITVYANDTGGNMGASDTVHFSVDAPPSIAIVSPANGSYTSTLVPLNFTLSESAHWIGYSLDGATNETVTGNTTITVPDEDLHNITVYANDTTSHMGASEMIYFIVDITPPNITDVSQSPEIVLPEDVVWVDATVADNLSGVKQVILNYTNGNGTWITVEMTKLWIIGIEEPFWGGDIPAFPYCTNVTYIIMAEDNVGNTITTEEMESVYQYHVIPEFPSILIFPLFIIATLLAMILYIKNKSVHN